VCGGGGGGGPPEQTSIKALWLHAQRWAAHTRPEHLGRALTSQHDIPLSSTPSVGTHGVQGDVGSPVEHKSGTLVAVIHP
jgi:hypothetical protein